MHVNRRIMDADHPLIILGGGPAGLTAAVYAARAGMHPAVLARDGGQLESTSIIDNFAGFEDGVDAVELLFKMTRQAQKYGATFHPCDAELVELTCRPFRVTCTNGKVVTSSAIIVATGARNKWLGAPGEMELLSRGVHTCATCDGFYYTGKHVAVVGGGDTAMEQALFLARMAERVTVIHRRDAFRASKAMATRVLQHPSINILWETTVVEFLTTTQMDVLHSNSATDSDANSGTADGDTEVLGGLRLFSKDMCEELEVVEPPSDGTTIDTSDLGNEYILPVEGVFVAIGHAPNTELVAALRRDEEGYIYTVPDSTLTSITGVYAAGDVRIFVFSRDLKVLRCLLLNLPSDHFYPLITLLRCRE